MKILGLISGGIDSPVAIDMMLSKGYDVDVIHFDNTPFYEKEEHNKVIKIIEFLRKKHYKFKAYLIPHGHALTEFKNKARNNMTCLLCKRQMLRMANIVCENKGYDFILTGDSMGQVASQTVDNIKCISTGISYPILRPLIGLDKQEIVQMAIKRGTYELSISFNSKCGAVPSMPRTAGHMSEIEHNEKRVDIDDIVKYAINNMKAI